MITEEILKENISSVNRRIAAACECAGREPSEVTLVVVTKVIPPEVVEMGIRCGLQEIGENRLQESADKFPNIPSLGSVHKHFIGVMQSNKVRHIPAMFDTCQSVCKVSHAKLLDRFCGELGKKMPIYVEINLGDEETKSGIAIEDAREFINKLLPLQNLQVEGIMAMPPLLEHEELRPMFRKAKELKDRLGLKTLSLGTSHDFEVAIEEGSTMVRLGTAIFGPRENLD